MPQPEAGTIRVVLGRLYEDLDQPDKALQTLSDPSVASSDLWEFGFRWRADLLTRQHRPEEALPVWRALFEAKGQPSFRLEAAQALADAADAAGDKTAAVPYVEALLAAKREDPGLTARLAGLYEDTGRRDDARPLAHWLWVTAPGSPAAQAFFRQRPEWAAGFKDLPPGVHLQRLKALAAAGLWKPLADELPGFSPIKPEEAAWKVILRGRLAQSKGQLHEALALYRSVTAPPEEAHEATQRLGMLLPSLSLQEQPARVIENAVAALPTQAPGRTEALLRLLRWRVRRGNEDRAAVLAEALLSGGKPQTDACAYLYHSGWELWMDGRRKAAQERWEALVRPLPVTADYRHAALYVMLRLGLLKGAAASEAREEILREDRYGYFGYRLRPSPPEPPQPPPPLYDEPPAPEGTHRAKAAELLRVGLAPDAETEFQLAVELDRSRPALWGLALVQTAARDYGGAIRTTRQVYPNAYDLSGDQVPRAAWRVLYPLPFSEAVERASREAGLTGLLLASVIRQESLWEPSAVSRSGAVGLMQLMPQTARALARRLGTEGPSAEDLVDPGWNVRAGAVYLKDLLDRFGGRLPAALAAYNAGAGRVAAWQRRERCPREPDLFIESIPFWETRAYVRRILLNLWEYRRLYPELKTREDWRYLESAGFAEPERR